MPAEFHFLRPDWLVALPLVVAAVVLLARRRLAAGNWQAVVSPALAPHVLARSPSAKDAYRWWLLGLGGVLAVLALAGPAWQRIEQPVFRSDQALVIALDMSRSMDAQDITPSRLVRARLKILDILARRQSGQTALVVYSANAFTVTPLTTDTDTIAALVNSLSTDIMPSRGSYPVAAIKKSQELLENAGAAVGEILLVTDGGTSPAMTRTARDLLDTGYSLSVLAVGTRDGAPIPLPDGGFVTDQAGNIAVPRLEEAALKSLARAGGGRFATVSTGNRDIDHLLSGQLGSRQAPGDTLATDRWREEGPWLLLLLLPLAALAFRRGWVLLAPLIFLPLAEPAQAGAWEDLWLTPDQQGRRLLKEGAAEEAAVHFEDPQWQAVANYRAGNFAASAAQFADRDDATSLYNLGNALARQGEFESAIDAYEQVLELDPEHADAAYNRDLLESMLEQQEQQQQQQQGDPQEQNDGAGEDEQQSESDGEAEQDAAAEEEEGEAGDSETSRRDAETSQEELDAMQQELERAAAEAQQDSEEPTEQLTAEELRQLREQREQQQAMEQWLRRIPNDPGSLLRNKFRYQYLREGRDQDGNDVWPGDEVQPW